MQAVPAALQQLFAAGLLFARRSNFARPFALECMNTCINRAEQPERVLLAYHQVSLPASHVGSHAVPSL